MLDRTGPTPLHHQIHQYVLDRVESGEWPMGTQIPPEKQLCEIFHVSRATVVRALTELMRQGVLDRQQGRGTYVASPRVLHGPFDLKSFTEEHTERGFETRSQVLAFVEEVASPTIASTLRIEPGNRVVRIRRLRYAGGDTMGIQEAFLPSSRVPTLTAHVALLTGSLYKALESLYGITPHRAVETFEPTMIDDRTAGLLGCPVGTLAFLVERVTFDPEGKPVEVVRSIMRGDRYRYSMELLRR